MQTQKHTAENGIKTQDFAEWRASKGIVFLDRYVIAQCFGEDESGANRQAERISSCLNALAGIENPEAIREVIEAARKAVSVYNIQSALSDLSLALAKLGEIGGAK